MGVITGLATVVTTLLVVEVVLGLVIVGLTLGVVLPAVAQTRADRRRRRLSVPAYYLRPLAH